MYDDVTHVYDDVTHVYDDVTHVYDDVTYAPKYVTTYASCTFLSATLTCMHVLSHIRSSCVCIYVIEKRKKCFTVKCLCQIVPSDVTQCVLHQCSWTHMHTRMILLHSNIEPYTCIHNVGMYAYTYMHNALHAHTS